MACCVTRPGPCGLSPSARGGRADRGSDARRTAGRNDPLDRPRDGESSGREPVLPLRVLENQTEEMRNTIRVGSKLCSVGNEWLRDSEGR
jgi:hypothetical protein